MRLSPQETEILDYLQDGEFHCMTSGTFFMKDDRARISALKRKGYEIESIRCDKRCGKDHNSGVVMRKLVGTRITEEVVRDAVEQLKREPTTRFYTDPLTNEKIPC